MTKYLLFWLYNRLKAVIKRETDYSVIYNVNAADESNHSKRALLIYLVKPFLLRDDDPEFLKHQNLKRCKQIATILGEFGYIVDVVDRRDIGFWPSRDYDLVTSDKVDLKGMDALFRRDAIKIFLATSVNHTVHNKSLLRGHEFLSKRRGCKVEVRRPYPEIMPYIMRSDAIIGVGNELMMSTWKEVFKGPAYPFNNYGFKETEFLLDSKNSLRLERISFSLQVKPKFRRVWTYYWKSSQDIRIYTFMYAAVLRMKEISVLAITRNCMKPLTSIQLDR